MAFNTAMSEKIKRENAVNELMRRHLNTLQGYPDSKHDTIDAINTYKVIMTDSGYSQTYRRDTILAALKGIEGKERQAAEGIRSYFRLQEEGARDRYRSKISQ